MRLKFRDLRGSTPMTIRLQYPSLYQQVSHDTWLQRLPYFLRKQEQLHLMMLAFVKWYPINAFYREMYLYVCVLNTYTSPCPYWKFCRACRQSQYQQAKPWGAVWSAAQQRSWSHHQLWELRIHQNPSYIDLVRFTCKKNLLRPRIPILVPRLMRNSSRIALRSCRR